MTQNNQEKGAGIKPTLVSILTFAIILLSYSSCNNESVTSFTIAVKPKVITEKRSSPNQIAYDLVLEEGRVQTIKASNLSKVTDPSFDDSSGVTITLTKKPKNGTLEFNGVALSAGDQFTLEDIENALITYRHDGSETAFDDFEITVKKSESLPAISGLVTIGVTAVDDPSVAISLTPPSFDEDTEALITLSYSDAENDLATSCQIEETINVLVTALCVCDTQGICRVGVTGTLEFNGSASFIYTVASNNITSNQAQVTLLINEINDAPLAFDLTAPSFDEDTISIITLSYTDAEQDPPTACQLGIATGVVPNLGISSLEGSECICTGLICKISVKGEKNFNGQASFKYTIQDSGGVSNSATVNVYINPVTDPHAANDLTAPDLDQNKEAIITLSYTDVDQSGELPAGCNLLPSGQWWGGLTGWEFWDSSVTQTRPCECGNTGVCTIGVTSLPEFSGPTQFRYQIIMNNGTIGDPGTVLINILEVNDPPVAEDTLFATIVENTDSTLTLKYSDVEGDLASGCTMSNLSHLQLTSPCTCAGFGICRVGVRGDVDYKGAASFNFTIKGKDGTSSNLATYSLSVVEPGPPQLGLFREDMIVNYGTLQYEKVVEEFPAPYSNPILTTESFTDNNVVPPYPIKVRYIGNEASIPFDRIEYSSEIEPLASGSYSYPDITAERGPDILIKAPRDENGDLILGEYFGTVTVFYGGTEARQFTFPVKATARKAAPVGPGTKVNVFFMADEDGDGNPINPVIPYDQATEKSIALMARLNEDFTRQAGPTGDPCTDADIVEELCESEQLVQFELDNVEFIADSEIRSAYTVQYENGVLMPALGLADQRYSQPGHINIFFMAEITGYAKGAAKGMSYRMTNYQKMTTVIDVALLDTHYALVPVHEIGHLAGLYHSAEDVPAESTKTKHEVSGIWPMINGTPPHWLPYFPTPGYNAYAYRSPSGKHHLNCGFDQAASYPVHKNWGGNDDYPSMFNTMSGGLWYWQTSLFKGQYFYSMADIIRCWNYVSHDEAFNFL